MIWIRCRQRFRMYIAVWHGSIRAHWHHLELLLRGNENFIRIMIYMPVSQIGFIRICPEVICLRVVFMQPCLKKIRKI